MNPVFKKQGEPTFGGEIRKLREAIGMSQSTLGQSIGVSVVFISDMERGARVTENLPPTIPKIRRMLQAMNQNSPEQLEKMILLAAEERGGFRIPTHGQSDDVKRMLCRVAQCVCNGTIGSHMAATVYGLLDS
jgi:transcriptional regulator with XRE-family HTH domain